MLGHTAQDRAMTYSGSSRPLSEPPDWSDPRVPLVVLDLASVETYLLVHLLSRTFGALWKADPPSSTAIALGQSGRRQSWTSR